MKISPRFIQDLQVGVIIVGILILASCGGTSASDTSSDTSSEIGHGSCPVGTRVYAAMSQSVVCSDGGSEFTIVEWSR